MDMDRCGANVTLTRALVGHPNGHLNSAGSFRSTGKTSFVTVTVLVHERMEIHSY